MYSIFDKQTGCYLHSGRNSKTKQEAINGAIEFLFSQGETNVFSAIRRLSYKKKESLINGDDLIVDEHEKEIDEDY